MPPEAPVTMSVFPVISLNGFLLLSASAIIVNIKCKTIEVTTTDFHQASRERPVSGHGQVRESVENGGGRPARYALARRIAAIFFR